MMNIYPPFDEIEKDAKNMTNKLECKHMLDQIKNMKDRLQHYQKLENRYRNIKIGTRISLHFIGLALEGTGIGLAFISIGASIPIGIAFGGLVDQIGVEILCKLIDIKVKKYQEKCRIIQKYIDELYLFIKRANADNVISTEEITEYQNILNEYGKEINKIQEDHNKEVKQVIDSAPKNEELQKKMMEMIQLMELTYGQRKTGT